MNNFLVQNEFNDWVVDGFAFWLSTHHLGDFYDLNPIHNDPPIDLFLIGVIND